MQERMELVRRSEGIRRPRWTDDSRTSLARAPSKNLASGFVTVVERDSCTEAVASHLTNIVKKLLGEKLVQCERHLIGWRSARFVGPRVL